MTWKAFLLRPEPTEPSPERQAKFVAYTQSWERPAAMEPAAAFRPWATANPAPSGSVPAHVAAKTMAEFAPELSRAYHQRLLDAYFAENRTISDPAVFGALAAEVGADSGAFLAQVAERQLVLGQQAIDEHNEAIERGITGVPTVLIDDTLPVQGAQDLASYERWIERLLDRREA